MTGIQKEESCSEAIEMLSHVLGIRESIPYRVDNITVSGRMGRKIPVNVLKHAFAARDPSSLVSFRAHQFAGVSIKYPDRTNIPGTITLFHTGSYTLVGVKSLQEAKNLLERISLVINELPT